MPVMNRIIPLLFLVFIATPIIVTAQPSANRGSRQEPLRGNGYAIIVGVEQDSSQIFDKLNYAGSDAKNFYEFLKSDFVTNRFDTNNIKLLVGKEARSSQIRNAFSLWLEGLKNKRKVKPGDVIYIYWSGHGMIDASDQVLICSNTVIEDLNMGKLDEKIPMSEIKRRIKWFAQQTGVKVFLIVDACRNNIMPQIRDKKIRTRLKELSGPGEIYMYACNCFEYSYETKDLDPGGGVFTHFLLLGLKGGADTKPDNSVSLQELRSYLAKAVDGYVTKYRSPGLFNQKHQIPDMDSGDGSAEEHIFLTTLPKAVAKENREKARKQLLDFQTLDFPEETVTLTPKGFHAPSAFIPRQVNATPATDPTPVSDTSDFAGDSILQKLHDTLRFYISKEQLIIPRNNSAYGIYQKIKKKAPGTGTEREACSELFIALLDKVKSLTDSYLAGNLPDTKRSQFDLALGELETALQLAPQDTLLREAMEPKRIFLQSRSLAGSHDPKDWTRGITLIDSALQIPGIDATLYHTLGILYVNKSRYFSAIKYFDKAHQKAPCWKYSLYSLADAYFRIQEYQQSMKYCDEILAFDSSYSPAYSLMAVNCEAIADYNKSKDYSLAIHWNNRALLANPANKSAYFNLGRIYAKTLANRKENIRRSFDYFHEGGRYGDEYCMAMLGKNYFDMGPLTYDSARYYFSLALQINPFNAKTLEYYSKLLSFNESDLLFIDALKKSQYDYKIYAAYKNSLFSRSPARADYEFRSILKLNDEDPSIFIEHSRLYQQIDSVVKARDILSDGLNHIPGSPSLYLHLARFYIENYFRPELGKYAVDSAGYYLARLHDAYPAYSLVNYELSRLALLKNDSLQSDTYQKIAQDENKFVASTVNSLNLLYGRAAMAIKAKRYTEALQLYRACLRLDDNKFVPAFNLIRTFYLNGQADSATRYFPLAERYLQSEELSEETDSTLFELYTLKALILLDNSDAREIRQALNLLTELLYDHNDNTTLEIMQAVAFMKLKQKKAARNSLPSDSRRIFPVYQRMSGQEDIYSAQFIGNMKQLASLIPGLIPADNDQPQPVR